MRITLSILLLLGFGIILNAQNKTNRIFADDYNILSAEQLVYFKKHYDFGSDKILIINYKQPKLICNDTKHSHNNQVKKWWKKFYSQIDLEQVSNIFVCSGYHKNEKNTSYYNDLDSYLYETFFKEKKSCFAILAINQKGNYYRYNGHYSEEQVSYFIKELKANTD